MIDAQHLVTAAHCVQAHDYFHAYVDEAMSVHLLDDGSLSVAGEDAKAPLHVESCTLHPRSEEPGFDLAVCRLSAGTNILPATFTRTNPTEGEQLILVGYGFDQVGGEAGTKRYVESSISGIASDVDGQELVIGDHMRGTCRGDSGGPAFRLADNGDDMVLVGLLSGGESGRCGFGWYTNLPLHLNWLEEVTQKTLAIEPVMAVASPQPHRNAHGCWVFVRDGPHQGRTPWSILVIGVGTVLGLRRWRSKSPRSHNCGSNISPAAQRRPIENSLHIVWPQPQRRRCVNRFGILTQADRSTVCSRGIA